MSDMFLRTRRGRCIGAIDLTVYVYGKHACKYRTGFYISSAGSVAHREHWSQYVHGMNDFLSGWLSTAKSSHQCRVSMRGVVQAPMR